jgi:CubicO group peptidase (beta-lactamase class C family)
MLTLAPEVRDRIQTELTAAGIPGCSLVVVKRDGISAAEAFGYASLTQARLATPHTAYHLFSATKLYTATAIMQLVEQGKLQLTEAVAHVLPEYRQALPPALTVQHLLSHTSGLKDTLKAFLAVHVNGACAPTTAEALSRYALHAKETPGRRVAYRNVNYALLGEIVTRRSGQPYTTYVTDHILHPLGMNVAFAFTPDMQSDAASGYIGYWNPLRLMLRWFMPDVARKVSGPRLGRWLELRDYNLDTAAIGGLVGSAVEFAPFVMAHLNEGRGILSPNSTQQMQAIVARGQAGFAARVGVGLGWKIGQVNGRAFLNHEGGGAGFTSETRLYPQDQIGIVMLMNVMGVKISQLAHRVCEMIRHSQWANERACHGS